MTRRPDPSAPERADASSSRRRFLLNGLGGMTVLGLGTWGALPDLRREQKAASDDAAATAIRIDVHSRVFNGQDVHLAGFLERVVAPAHPEHAPLIRAGAGVAQALAWALAPSGAAETWRLDELARRRGPMLASGDDPAILRDREDGNRRFHEALRVVLPQTEFFRLYVDRMVPEVRAVLGRAAATRLGRMARAVVLGGDDVEFLLSADGPERIVLPIRPLAAFRRYTHYRYLEVRELLQPDGGLADLVVPTVAVFDGGSSRSAPPTPWRDQLMAISRLVTLCGGRLHPLVPFDPRDPADARDSLALVQDAVEHRGFAGVTLMVPVGAAVTGRDDGLHVLLEWCVREEVPVVMPGGSAAETAAILARHPGLRLGVRTSSPADLEGSGWPGGSPMQGLDWVRRSIEGDAQEIHRLDARGGATAGRHAADFLGLQRGRRTRQRLEHFYDRQRMTPPAWLRALDGEGPGGSTRG